MGVESLGNNQEQSENIKAELSNEEQQAKIAKVEQDIAKSAEARKLGDIDSQIGDKLDSFEVSEKEKVDIINKILQLSEKYQKNIIEDINDVDNKEDLKGTIESYFTEDTKENEQTTKENEQTTKENEQVIGKNESFIKLKNLTENKSFTGSEELKRIVNKKEYIINETDSNDTKKDKYEKLYEDLKQALTPDKLQQIATELGPNTREFQEFKNSLIGLEGTNGSYFKTQFDMLERVGPKNASEFVKLGIDSGKIKTDSSGNTITQNGETNIIFDKNGNRTLSLKDSNYKLNSNIDTTKELAQIGEIEAKAQKEFRQKIKYYKYNTLFFSKT